MADGDEHKLASVINNGEHFQLERDAFSLTLEPMHDTPESHANENGGALPSAHCTAGSRTMETDCANETDAVESNGDASARHNDVTISDEGGAELSATAADGDIENFSFLPEIEALIARDREVIQRLQEERLVFMRKMEEAEAAVRRVAEHMYGLVDNKANEMLATASSVRMDGMAELERTRAELESSVTSLRVNEDFVRQALDEAGPREVMQFAPAVQRVSEHFKQEEERIHELSRMTVDDERIDTLNAFADLDVANWARNAGGNLVGHVTTSESVEAAVDAGCTVPYVSEAQPLGVLTAGSRVQGLAFLKNCLYVLLERCAVVGVYDVDTMNSIEQVVVEQLSFPDRIVGAEAAQCVFVSDSEIPGLFRLSPFPDVEISLLPLEGIPAGLSISSNGHLAFVDVNTKTVHLLSTGDGSIARSVSINDICRPILAVPVPGDDNGVVVCNETDKELQWFLCGHQLDCAAAAELEAPVPLYSLNNISHLIPDTYGMYIGLNAINDCVGVFDASFYVYRSLLTKSEDCCDMCCVGFDPHSGKLAVGCRSGAIRLFQVMHTRKRIEVHLRKWM